MKKYLLIITAGGIGKRFNKAYPKQLEKIFDKSIILKTAEFFEKIPPIHCVITYPDGFIEDFKNDLDKINYKISFVKGGMERHHSVKNAIDFFVEQNYAESCPVLVHDGVRPFLNMKTVKSTIELTEKNKAAIPYIPISGTMRKIENNYLTETLDRINAVTVTTPQGCQLGILNDCFKKSEKTFTDESTMLDFFNIEQKTVKDWHLNIKITEQKDIKSAEILWNNI